MRQSGGIAVSDSTGTDLEGTSPGIFAAAAAPSKEPAAMMRPSLMQAAREGAARTSFSFSLCDEEDEDADEVKEDDSFTDEEKAIDENMPGNMARFLCVGGGIMP